MSRIDAPLAACSTLTRRQRRLLPARYARKDARAQALRLAYGPQSKLTTEIVQGAAPRLAEAEVAQERGRLLQALGLTGYDEERRRRILAAFDRRHAGPREG